MSINNRKLSEIVDLVANYYGVEGNTLFGRSRRANVAKARQVIAYCLRKKLFLSFPAIGSFLRRDHTTAMHSCKKVEKLIKQDASVRRLVGSIIGEEDKNEFYSREEESVNKKIPEEEVKKPKKTVFYKYRLPKCNPDASKFTFPIEFNLEYFAKVLDKLESRKRSIIIDRFGFANDKYLTLNEIAVKEQLTRERIRQLIDSVIREICFNNYGGSMQILKILSRTTKSEGIVSVKDFSQNIFVQKNNGQMGLLKFLTMISTQIKWIKILILSSEYFWINKYKEDEILNYIDEVKKIIKSISNQLPDHIENKWEYIFKALKLNKYFEDKIHLLGETFLRACYDNYLFESEIVFYKREDLKKYKSIEKKPKIPVIGVPSEYKTFFN